MPRPAALLARDVELLEDHVGSARHLEDDVGGPAGDFLYGRDPRSR